MRNILSRNESWRNKEVKNLIKEEMRGTGYLAGNTKMLNLLKIKYNDFQNTVESLHIQKVRISSSMDCHRELSVTRDVHFSLWILDMPSTR